MNIDKNESTSLGDKLMRYGPKQIAEEHIPKSGCVTMDELVERVETRIVQMLESPSVSSNDVVKRGIRHHVRKAIEDALNDETLVKEAADRKELEES
jgi:hypothetical protein